MNSAVVLFNTLGRCKQEFEPIDPRLVRVYTCGPTVYNYAHIGNMRAYLFADLLVRILKYAGYPVKHVMNITDVGHLVSDADEGEDKMEKGAQREGLSAWEIAEKYTAAFFADSEKLQIRRPDVIPKATDHIGQQIELIRRLEEKGYTYVTTDGVYFDTSCLADYGKLALLDREGLVAGKRVEVGAKRNKTDFALWKFSGPVHRQMEWDSPWGRGFPGWHIECSAMSMFYLGEQFDIHTGGIDHIPIHHTNEIAQSEAATGRVPFVKYWMHSDFVLFSDRKKMAKSAGNIITVHELEQKGYEPLAYRYLCMTAHYRTVLKLSDQSLRSAATAYDRMRARIQRARASADRAGGRSDLFHEYRSKIHDALFDDLNSPIALAEFGQAIKDERMSAGEVVELAAEFDAIFGLSLLGERTVEPLHVVPREVQQLAADRERARAARKWEEADRLRVQLNALGYTVTDNLDGSTSVKRTPMSSN
jgi:cysteinyl-tRNA synthetase